MSYRIATKGVWFVSPVTEHLYSFSYECVPARMINIAEVTLAQRRHSVCVGMPVTAGE